MSGLQVECRSHLSMAVSWGAGKLGSSKPWPRQLPEVAGSLAQLSPAGVGPESLDGHRGRRGKILEGTWTLSIGCWLEALRHVLEPEPLDVLWERA